MSSMGSLAAHNPYGIGARSPINSGAGMGRSPFGAGGRSPMSGTGAWGAVIPTGSASLLDQLGIARARRPASAEGVGNGRGINSTAMNRTAISNGSVSVNRTSNSFNSVNSFNGGRNGFAGGNWGGRNSYAGLHQSWLNGRWGGRADMVAVTATAATDTAVTAGSATAATAASDTARLGGLG